MFVATAYFLQILRISRLNSINGTESIIKTSFLERWFQYIKICMCICKLTCAHNLYDINMYIYALGFNLLWMKTVWYKKGHTVKEYNICCIPSLFRLLTNILNGQMISVGIWSFCIHRISDWTYSALNKSICFFFNSNGI